jgi:MYXO-CTERM domain-containing protein
MTFPFCKRTVLAVMLLLTVLVAVVSPSVALAQAPAGQTGVPPMTRTETRDDDDSGRWGLLGLLGLVGLAGLLRRDKARSDTVADRPDRR